LAVSRAALRYRAVVVAGGEAELVEGLSRIVGEVAVSGRRVVMVFPGQGGQWLGMARSLMVVSPVFAGSMCECARVIDPLVGDWSLLDEGTWDLDRVDVVQPVLFAVMVSLAAVWRSLGVVPAAVVGHSQGEIAAACVAGALSVQDAARVVVLRAQALRQLAGSGAMASIARPVSEAPDGVSVAAVNGPSSFVVSGDVRRVRQIVAGDERARLIPVDYASHSAYVESLVPHLREVLGQVDAGASVVPVLSTVTGDWFDTTGMDADYWVRNLREPVRFHDAV
ncbi:acyltransferase domain-containing protein, partial [Micromonospora sp. CPCC 205546]|uniref:acyltransferase domain-containing protein n=1 Tax=Micromonospora sp. CPCC 205546 TaxID=3122397 RepID=UPI002FF085D1